MKTVMIKESMYIVEILVKNCLEGANFNSVYLFVQTRYIAIHFNPIENKIMTKYIYIHM